MRNEPQIEWRDFSQNSCRSSSTTLVTAKELPAC